MLNKQNIHVLATCTLLVEFLHKTIFQSYYESTPTATAHRLELWVSLEISTVLLEFIFYAEFMRLIIDSCNRKLNKAELQTNIKEMEKLTLPSGQEIEKDGMSYI